MTIPKPDPNADPAFTRLRLFIIRDGKIVDVVDAWPSDFSTWLPDYLANYSDCTIKATLYQF